MSPKEQDEILAFVRESDHGWKHQPTATVASAQFETNPEAKCIEITVMVGDALSDQTGRYRPETSKVFSMAGARMALGY